MSYSGKDPLWYKEKSKYKDTACSSDGHCGPVCVAKRISRGYKATKSFNDERKEVKKVSRQLSSKNSTAPDDLKLVSGRWAKNDDYNEKSSRTEKKWNAAQFAVSDVAIPAAGGTFGPEGFAIGCGVAAAVHAGKSVANAYSRGALIDKAMLDDKRKG